LIVDGLGIVEEYPRDVLVDLIQVKAKRELAVHCVLSCSVCATVVFKGLTVDGSSSEVPSSWPQGERQAGGTAAGGSRGRGVAAAVVRDRALARLGLGIVEEYPRDVLVDLIQVRLG
jgi:hypothetical protein